MTQQAAPRQVDDIVQLVDTLELKAIRFFELSARRASEEREGGPEISMEVQQRQTPELFEPRFRMTVVDANAEYVVDVASRYDAAEPIAFSTALAAEFIERVAVMAAYPFLREGLAASAARLELTVPMLGLLRQGQFKIEVSEETQPTER